MIWERMVNLQDKVIRMPHDGYLKLWQLSKPRLTQYDALLIDEAQDLTPGDDSAFIGRLRIDALSNFLCDLKRIKPD